MIGSIFKRATRIFRTTNLHSNVVVGAFSSRAEPTRNFSSTVDSAAMASVQETQVVKRVVGKKFVIACDGESHIVSRYQE
jgi:putative methionine-R-sulfoxide reductase with GAF domain